MRYSNVTRRYGVRYWALGNETYLRGYNGYVRATDYARDLVLFSRALKAVDPAILLGANGHAQVEALGQLDEADWRETMKKDPRAKRPGPWWKTALETASAAIGFLDVHPYPCYRWGRYERYIDVEADFTEAADGAREAIRRWAPRRDRKRLRVCATEANSADWSRPGGWPHHNTLGHALVLFDIIGAHIVRNNADMLLVWNTRWRPPRSGVPQLWDAVDERNGLRPTGRVVAIWGKWLGERMVGVRSVSAVPAYATFTPRSQRLTVFLLNKDLLTADVRLHLRGFRSRASGERWLFRGSGPEDLSPVWRRVGRCRAEGGRVALALPPVSLTVLDFRRTD